MVDLGEIVYFLGAGVNQVIKDWDGHSPPLLANFFKIALSKRKFENERFSRHMQPVYDYIEEYFKKTKDDLAKCSFDLELCFTLLEQQIKRAERDNNKPVYQKLLTIQFRLASFLAEVLSDFDHFAFRSCTMRNFGKVLFYENPTIITFNYDCLLESILETTSGVNPDCPKSFYEPRFLLKSDLPDELLIYSHCKWNRPLGYGFKFNEIQLQQAGVSKFVKGSRFYSISQNQLYQKPLLKLHGSLNWFRYLPIRSFPVLPGEPDQRLDEKENETILKQGTWWFGRPPDHDGWFIEPIIITPLLYKEKYYNDKPFIEIWDLAKKNLSICDKLVVIGYSFSPSDFTTKQLLIESLVNNNLKELVVVNPNHDVVKVVKELCHFEGGIVWFSSLDEYLKTFSNSVNLESESILISETDLPNDTSPHDLYVKCKTCDIEFPAKIRTNPRSFATSQYHNNTHGCPNGHQNSYDKADYKMKKVEKT